MSPDNLLIKELLRQTNQNEVLELKELVIKLLENQNTSNKTPLWIQNLVDSGLIAPDAKTVIAPGITQVAVGIHNQNIELTPYHLKFFVKAKDGKPYSKSAIEKAVEYANTLKISS